MYVCKLLHCAEFVRPTAFLLRSRCGVNGRARLGWACAVRKFTLSCRVGCSQKSHALEFSVQSCTSFERRRIVLLRLNEKKWVLKKNIGMTRKLCRCWFPITILKHHCGGLNTRIIIILKCEPQHWEESQQSFKVMTFRVSSWNHLILFSDFHYIHAFFLRRTFHKKI